MAKRCRNISPQLEMSRLNDRDMRIGAAIVDAINDDGYVIEPLDEIARNLQPEIIARAAEVERVLRHVQAMDPAGVGARSVSECFELQLRQLVPIRRAGKPLSQSLPTISTSCRTAVRGAATSAAGHRRGNGVRAGAGACLPAATRFERAFRSRRYLFRTSSCAGPTWLGGGINPASLPRIRVNQSYAGLIGRSADHAMLRTQLQEARWLIRSFEIRNETLLKVARASCSASPCSSRRRRVHAADDP